MSFLAGEFSVGHQLKINEALKRVEGTLLETIGEYTRAVKRDSNKFVRRARKHREFKRQRGGTSGPWPKTHKTIKSRARNRADGTVRGWVSVASGPGMWLELGTKDRGRGGRMRAFPFIEPAIRKNQPRIPRGLRKAIR